MIELTDKDADALSDQDFDDTSNLQNYTQKLSSCLHVADHQKEFMLGVESD